MIKNLVIRETYEQNGEEKVSWNIIGKLIESNGKQYVKLNHIPNTLLHVFENDKKEDKQAEPQTNNNDEEIDWS